MFSAGWHCNSCPVIAKACQVVRTQSELPMPGLAEERKKNVNRPVPELLPMADDTDMVPVKAGKGNGHKQDDAR